MNYIPHTEAERQHMLDVIGVKSIEDLFDAVPEKVRFPKLKLPEPLTEMEVAWEMQSLSDANADVNHYACFLGAGAYNHHVPSLVDHLIRRGEFLTAYTPYQPEVSQGTLQAIFEFQSMIGQLTGMEIATASHYDGATAFAEAVSMSVNTTHRNKVLISAGVHPMYRQVVRTYTQFLDGVQVSGDEVDATGFKSIDALVDLIDDDTAALCVANPNFFGQLEALEGLAERVHAKGALLVLTVNPTSLALFKTPGDYGADIVTGEGQPLGVPISYGGPFVGFFCTRREYMRRIPGRIVGETVDREGKRGYVLTLKTREQDIRREKATSNICTNQGLMALCATIYLSVMGKNGLKQVANLSYQKAHYAAQRIATLKGFTVHDQGPFFHEFVVKCPAPVSEINALLLDDFDMIGGYDLGRDYPHLKDHMLICCTEQNTRDEIDELVDALDAARDELAQA
ncbi:MAG: aminomethyl-transferring glycine dehydrogenase subunit GcvPA [Thermoflexales bacterium]|nr:aminomethyl-transferring glycine dehydrogenase subunit GcvPA [Thermoflexales bacterium]